MQDKLKKGIVAVGLGLAGLAVVSPFGSTDIQVVPPMELKGSFISDEYIVKGDEGHIEFVADLAETELTKTGAKIDIQIQVFRNGEWQNWGACGWSSSQVVNTKLEQIPRPTCGASAIDLKGQKIRAVFTSPDVQTGIKVKKQ